MPVTATTISGVGDLTFDTLKQYAIDQMSDRTDAKAVRRSERVVNQAVRRLAGEKNWAWHLRRHRIVLRGRSKVTNVSMSALGNTVTLLSGSWASNAAKASWIFSGDTEVMRIKSRDSSTQLTTFSTDVYIASSDTSGASGHLVFDRYEMDENFKCIAEDLHQKDFFGPDGEIPRAEMLHLNQTYTPSTGSPINYVLDINPVTKRYEIVVWQWPNELRSADLYVYVWPAALSNDSDVLDWDPNQSAVVYASINRQCMEELNKWKEWPLAEKAYQRELVIAKNSDRKTLVSRVGGKPPHRAKWVQLNRPFTSES